MYEKLKYEISKFKYKNKQLIYFGKRIRINKKLLNSDFFKNSELYNKIIKTTKFLSETTSIYLRIKCIFNNINSIPKCPICKNECKFSKISKFKTVFTETCGNKICIAKNATNHISKQSEKTKLKHSITQTLYKKTIIEKFNNLLNNYFKKNFKITEKNKLINFLNDNLNKQNKNGTILKDKDLEINKNFILNLFYYTNFIKIPKNIKSKIELSITERIYCILNNITELKLCSICKTQPIKFISFKLGYSKSCKKCCGENFRNTIGYPSLEEIKTKIDTNKYEIISFPTYTDSEQLIIKCKKCGKISKHWLYNGKGKNIEHMHLCPVCDNDGTSYEEKEIVNYIKSIYSGEVLENIKTIIPPQELDIYLPKKQLAFEFDGLFWHSDANKNEKNYHLYKTEECKKKNIHLIHIFENEWLFKKEIVKSRIRNLLGIFDNIVYARLCEIKKVSSKISNIFQEKNHIQGAVNCSINLGLFYNNELISLMTFSKTRFSKKYEYELVRFCNKLGYHIPGAAGKLLKYFERNFKPKSLISYADRKWSEGNLYEKLNFKLKSKVKPNYWYFKSDDLILESRIKYQKHKLKKILPIFSEKLSESENMKKNKYLRIFDCGNLVYVKEY